MSKGTASTLAVASFAAAAAVTLGASNAHAHAGDHWPVAGGTLQMRSTSNGFGNKFVFKAKNQLSINPTSILEDPTASRSSLTVRSHGDNGATTGPIELDQASWRRIGPADSPRGWKYKGAKVGAPGGIAKISIKTGSKGGGVQVVAKGIHWPYPIYGPQEQIEVVLSIGAYAFCSEYSDDSDADFRVNQADRVLAKSSLAPLDCPQVCGNGILEVGEECDDGNLFDGDTCSDQCVGCNPADAEYDTTFEAIQELIFDNPTYGCSNDACHGSSQQGGLDLRQGASHASLVGVASSIHPATTRVYPGDQDLSMLYLKLAKKTLDATDPPGVTVGTAMPSGGATVTEEHLEAIRLWIRSGASETSAVEGTAALLGSCLPAPTPLNIPQPEIPDPAVGTQFAMPAYNLPSSTEVEGCVASYYDLSAPGAVPPGMMVDCPGAFPGTNDHGTNSGKCFAYKTNALFQDAQSHHSIVHIYTGDYDWNAGGWGSWRCYGGPTPSAACDPTTANACGSGGVCGSRFHAAVACLGTWGAPDYTNFGNKGPQFSGSQESTVTNSYPTGVYSVLPLKGLIIWNSHAFNLTNQDTDMNAWINMEYAADKTWPALGLFNDDYIFTQFVPPFEQREYCATHTFPENTHLFNLTSHNHKRGIRWRYYSAPQTPCGNGGFSSTGGLKTSASCTPGAPASLLSESYAYSDPTTLNFDPPMVFSGSAANRTIKFCALFDNGFNNPATVKTQSGSPEPSGGELYPGGPCDDDARYCLGGASQGAPCVSDANCPGSICDACMLTGGVTTEDEMFIAIGTYYIP